MVQTNFEIKKSNVLRFFGALQANDRLSRRELELITGLSWGSVSAISNELLKKGLIIAEKEAFTSGRPAEKLEINSNVRLYLGIDINSVGINFNVVNLRKKSVYSKSCPVLSNKKEDLLSLLYEHTKDILGQFEDIIGINLSVQGTMDRETGVSFSTHFFENWKNVPLVSLFEERFGIPTSIYHDPEALMSYHMCEDERIRNLRNGVVIRVDDGIGMALLVNGEPYETGPDTACELGHTIAVPDGSKCVCGRKGCLEVYSALRGMKYAYSPDKNISSEELFELIENGDERALAIMETATYYLGIAISNLFTLCSPEFIILDGLAIAGCPRFFEKTVEIAERYMGKKCNLLKAEYKSDAAAIGACIYTIDKRLENILFEE